jgi:hypothetical protein
MASSLFLPFQLQCPNPWVRAHPRGHVSQSDAASGIDVRFVYTFALVSRVPAAGARYCNNHIAVTTATFGRTYG